MALKQRFMPCLTLQIYLFCIYCVKLRTFVIFQCVCYHFVGHFHPSCCTPLFHVALLSFSVLQFTAKPLLLQFANLLQLIVSLVCRKQGPKFWNCFAAMFVGLHTVLNPHDFARRFLGSPTWKCITLSARDS